jgi:hypothetical protein
LVPGKVKFEIVEFRVDDELGISSRTVDGVGSPLTYFLDDCFGRVTALLPIFGDNEGTDFSDRGSCLHPGADNQADNEEAHKTTDDGVEAFQNAAESESAAKFLERRSDTADDSIEPFENAPEPEPVARFLGWCGVMFPVNWYGGGD